MTARTTNRSEYRIQSCSFAAANKSCLERVERGVVRAMVGVAIAVCAAGGAAGQEVEYRFERMWPTLQQPWYFDTPVAVASDDSGNVYVAEYDNWRVSKFSDDGQFLTSFGSFGYGPGLFVGPAGITVSLDGFVYVTDFTRAKVLKFDSDGDFIQEWGDPSTEARALGELNYPSGIATDSLGDVYVVDFTNRVSRFTADGAPVLSWSGVGPVSFSGGIAISIDDRVLIPISGIQGVLEFTTRGDYMGIFANPSPSFGGFAEFDYALLNTNGPFGIAIAPSGDVFVTDTGASQVVAFSRDGDFTRRWSTPEGYPSLPGPYGISVNKHGNVFVATPAFDLVQKFSSEAQLLSEWTPVGQGHGLFSSPEGIATDDESNIYVADTGNNRIQKFGPLGEFLAAWDRPLPSEEPYDLVSRVAVSPNGLVYAVDGCANSWGCEDVVVLHPDGTFVERFESHSPTGLIKDIALAARGKSLDLENA